VIRFVLLHSFRFFIFACPTDAGGQEHVLAGIFGWRPSSYPFFFSQLSALADNH
jgi:hypothetical protein